METLTPPDFISAFSDFLGHYANNQNSVLSQVFREPDSNTSIASQSPTRGIISTLMSRAGDRILANQAEWWYSTDLTNLDQRSAQKIFLLGYTLCDKKKYRLANLF